MIYSTSPPPPSLPLPLPPFLFSKPVIIASSFLPPLAAKDEYCAAERSVRIGAVSPLGEALGSMDGTVRSYGSSAHHCTQEQSGCARRSEQTISPCVHKHHATRGGREGERNIICGPLMDVRGKWGEEGERGSRGRDSIHRGNQPAAVFAIGVSRYGGDGRWRFLPLPWFLALFYPS